MNESRKTTMRHAVLSGISFGGTYACLVFTNRETKEVI